MIFDFLKKKNETISLGDTNIISADAPLLKLQLEAVQIVSHQLINQTNLEDTLNIVVRQLVGKLNYINPSVYILNEDKKTFSVKKVNVPKLFLSMAEKIIGKSIYSVKFSLDDENLLSKTIKSGELQISRDLYELLAPHISKSGANLLQKSLNLGIIIVTPIKLDSQPIGCLVLTKHEKEITDSELKLISTFSDQISIAIFNARSFAEKQRQLAAIEEQNKDLGSLFNLSTQISKTLDPVQVAQNAVNSLPQNEFMVGGMILNYDPTESQVWVTAVTQNAVSEKVMGVMGDFSQYKTKLDDPKAQKSPVIQAVKTETLAYTNELNDVLYPLPKRIADAAAKLINIRSVVAYPIKTQGKTIGVVAYFLKDKGYDEVEDNKKQLISTYTLQINIALENAYLYAESQATRQHLEDALYQLKEARRLEKDMIDVMGHELRTPISIVRNALVMVEKQMERQRQIESSELHKYMDMALESTRREITLIETLLSATKVDAARMQMYFTKVDLKDVINDGIEGQKAQLEKKKEVQVTYTPPAEDIFVFADRTRMQEIMDNLYSNAVKYTLKGNITIQTWQDKDYGWISIADQGIGISAEDLQNLGKKFFRARQYVNDGGEVEDTEIVRPGGTGLGLYVTYDLVRIMGGTLYINSEIGKGSTFTVSIPLFKDQADKQVDETFDIEDKSKHTHVLINKTLPQPPQA